MRSAAAPVLPLAPEVRRQLEAWIRAGTVPQRVARRARIVTLAADGMSNRAIGRRLGISPHTAALWRQRFASGGINSLVRDAPGRGRKNAKAGRLSDVVNLLSTVRDDGRRWTVRQLAKASGLSAASIHRLLRANGLSAKNENAPLTVSPLHHSSSDC
jgi:transposase